MGSCHRSENGIQVLYLAACPPASSLSSPLTLQQRGKHDGERTWETTDTWAAGGGGMVNLIPESRGKCQLERHGAGEWAFSLGLTLCYNPLKYFQVGEHSCPSEKTWIMIHRPWPYHAAPKGAEIYFLHVCSWVTSRKEENKRWTKHLLYLRYHMC